MIEYVILGTSHTVQDESAFVRPLRVAIRDFSIDMVAEEFPFDVDSVVRRVVREMHARYLQIDMNPGEQIAHGIYEELRKRRECLAGEDCRLSHGDEIREKFWLDKIESETDSGRVLVVCGYLHVNYLAEKVSGRSGRVERILFFPSYLDGKPSMILSPRELDEYCKKYGLQTGWPPVV